MKAFFYDNQLLITFIALNIFNVIMQTFKSIATIKCKKFSAAMINAVAYGLYTVVTVYMMCELPLGWKAGIVALCNLVGVYVVKWIEEKTKKDKLWKVEAAIVCENPNAIKHELIENGISNVKYSNDFGKYTKFEIISENQEESRIIRRVMDQYGAQYFATEGQVF